MLSVSRRMHDRDASRPNGFASAVQMACHLVRVSDAATIRSITVVGGRRLTGAELLGLREEAGKSRVLLTMDNTGTVRLRRAAASRSCRAEQAPDPITKLTSSIIARGARMLPPRTGGT